MANDNAILTTTSSIATYANDAYQPGTWYSGQSKVKAMSDWCIANKKAFFIFYTNLAGGCSFC